MADPAAISLTRFADAGRPEWVTVNEAAARLQCGPRTIYRAVAAGELRASRINARGDLRISTAWLSDWLLRATDPPARRK